MSLSSSQPKRVKYPKQPLREVVCEIRFYGEPAIENKRADFYEKIREKYPLLYVPPIQPEQHPSLLHYKFEREDHTATVGLAVNSLVYFEREYSGAPKFTKEVVRLFDILYGLVKIQSFSRVGWRYVNEIPFTREDNLIPIGRFFKDPPNFFAIKHSECERINFNASTHFEDCAVSARLESDSDTSGGEVLYFDVDTYRDDLRDTKFPASEISDLISKLHCLGRNFFDYSITDKYKEYLEGKYDE